MVPKLTKEERIANLAKANQLRKGRAEIRRKISLGYVSFADVAKMAEDGNKLALGMRVRDVISAFPDHPLPKTESVMRALDLSRDKRISGLGKNQIQALINELDGGMR